MRSAKIESDADLARLLASDVKDETGANPVHTRGAFYFYNPKHGTWEVITDESIRQRFQSYHRSIRSTAKVRNPIVLITSPLQEAALKVLQTIAYSPDYFDDVPLGVSFRNGFLSVDNEKIQLIEQSPSHRCDYGYDYDFPKSSAPQKFLALLETLFHGDPDIESKILVIREYIAACLLGVAARRLQTTLLFFGESGNNGKSLLINAIAGLFHPSARRSLKPKDWTDEYYIADLAGARINLVGELPESELPDTATFKDITGGDEVSGRFPHGRVFKFRPVAGNIFACNKLPRTDDHSGGFFRRFTIITFNNTFDRSKSEDELLRPVFAEAASIVRWALEAGPGLLARNKLVAPASHGEMLDVWQAHSNTVKAFLLACTVKGGSTPCQLSYDTYRDFCRKSGVASVTFQVFTQRLGMQNIVSKRIGNGFGYPITLLKPDQWRMK